MLYTIAIILLIAWLLGLSVFPLAGALIHLVLLVAIVLFLVGLFQRRRA